jgi:hypothetical protein
MKIEDKYITETLEDEKKKLKIEEIVKVFPGWKINPCIEKGKEGYVIIFPSHMNLTKGKLRKILRHELYHLIRHKRDIESGCEIGRNLLIDIPANIYAYLGIKL